MGRRWDRVPYEFKKRIVELGGKFYKQKDLAKKLGIPAGTVASFRRSNGVPMPVDKVPQQGPAFDKFSKLLDEYNAVSKPTPRTQIEETSEPPKRPAPPLQPVQPRTRPRLKPISTPLPKTPVLQVHENPELIRLSPVDKMLKERMRQLPPPDVGEFHRNPAKDLAYGVWLSETLLLMQKLGAKPIRN